jgi:hypothetical protein
MSALQSYPNVVLRTGSRLNKGSIAPLPQWLHGKLLYHKGAVGTVVDVMMRRDNVPAHETTVSMQQHVQVSWIRPYPRHLPSNVFGRTRQSTVDEDEDDGAHREKEDYENEVHTFFVLSSPDNAKPLPFLIALQN